MKNPNGYGTIKKLSGARRRPFVFMISANGKQKAMGYFATKLEAMVYQVDYYVKPSKKFDTNLLLTKELPNLKSTASIVCIVILFCC